MRADEDLRHDFDGLGGWKPKGAAGEGSSLRFTLEPWRSTTAFTGSPPQIDWLVENAIPLGVPGMVASGGDLGKSLLLLALGLRVACGSKPLEQPLFGGRVVGRGAVVIVTAED